MIDRSALNLSDHLSYNRSVDFTADATAVGLLIRVEGSRTANEFKPHSAHTGTVFTAYGCRPWEYITLPISYNPSLITVKQ